MNKVSGMSGPDSGSLHWGGRGGGREGQGQGLTRPIIIGGAELVM